MNTFDQGYRINGVYRLHFDHAPNAPEAGEFARVDVVVTDTDKDHIAGYQVDVTPGGMGTFVDTPDDFPQVRIRDELLRVRKSSVVIRRTFGTTRDLHVAKDATGNYDTDDADTGPTPITDGGHLPSDVVEPIRDPDGRAVDESDDDLPPGIYVVNATGDVVALATEAGDGDRVLLTEAFEDYGVDPTDSVIESGYVCEQCGNRTRVADYATRAGIGYKSSTVRCDDCNTDMKRID